MTDVNNQTYVMMDSVVVVNDMPLVNIEGQHPTVGEAYVFRASSFDLGKIVQYEWKIGQASVFTVGTAEFKRTWNLGNVQETLFVRVKDEDGNEVIKSKPYAVFGLFTDSRDQKSYKSVKIGNQIWMAENLNYGSYVSDQNASGTIQDATQKFCYTNAEANCNTDGGLYQWHVAMGISTAYATSIYNVPASGNIKGICPIGWHIPRTIEWDALQASLGGSSVAAGQMKLNQTGFGSWDGSINNHGNGSGFSVLPAGQRFATGGYDSRESFAHFWEMAEIGASDAYVRRLNFSDSELVRDFKNKKNGFSLRCVRD